MKPLKNRSTEAANYPVIAANKTLSQSKKLSMPNIGKSLSLFIFGLAISHQARADIVIEAEDTLLVGPTIETGRAASGDAYIDYQNLENDYLEFQVDVATTGSYTLQTIYQLGAATTRPLALSVNGELADGDFILPTTGSWETWSESEYVLALTEGSNIIRLEATGSSGPNIDLFTIKTNGISETARLEAENATLSGPLVFDSSNASGGAYADFQNPSDDFIEWQVEVDTDGRYFVEFGYALGVQATRPLALSINNTVVDEAFTLPLTGTWGNWSTFGQAMNFSSGVNTVRLSAIGDSGPNFDYLDVILPSDSNATTVRVNFANAEADDINGYIKDFGEAYGVRASGQTYGWLNEATAQPTGFTSYGRNRNKSYDLKKDTLMHMDHPDANTARGVWELEVPNGNYQVTVQVGDTDIEKSETLHVINAESQRIIEYSPSLNATGSRIATTEVEVSDGRLTLDAIGGTNTKIQFVLVEPLTNIKTPFVQNSIPRDGETDVQRDTVISANSLFLPNSIDGSPTSLNDDTITTDNVRLYLVQNGVRTLVEGSSVNGTGGGDAINLTPPGTLEANATYELVIEGVEDLSQAQVLTTSISFTTGTKSTDIPSSLADVSFENRGAVASNAGYTTLTFGPDNKLYGASDSGEIHRWEVAGDGSLFNKEVLVSWLQDYGPRIPIGFVFAPESTSGNLIAYVTHSEATLENAPTFDGKLSRLSGPNLENEELIVTNLPRSVRDHLTNSIAFRDGEPQVLYFLQGSNSAGGAADGAWGNRPERLLTAALLRLNLEKLPASLPLDVRTTMDQAVINAADINNPLMSDGTYNPYYVDAPLTLFATGIRNAYDLVWHSNGFAYIPTNGTAGQSISPASVEGTRRPDGTFYSGQSVPRIGPNEAQRDFLFKVDFDQPGEYFGHPNPLRGEYVLNRGPIDAAKYPADIVPDENYAGFAYDFAFNKSPNGVIEYKSSAHNGALQGALLVVRYSGGSDVIALVPNGTNGNIGTEGIGLPGLTGFVDPLDLIEDVNNGNLYVSDYETREIILLTPSGNGDDSAPAILIQNPTAIPSGEYKIGFDDVFAFSRIETPKSYQKQHDRNTVQVSNTGTAALIIDDITLSDPEAFALVDVSLPITIAPNSTTEIEVLFTLSDVEKGLYEETMTLHTNLQNNPQREIALNGLYMPQPEGNNEVDAQDIMAVFGYTTSMNGEPRPSSDYPLAEDVTNGVHGDLVLSPYWQVADIEEPVIAVKIAAFKGVGGAGFLLKYEDGTTAGNLSFSFNSDWHQSILPAAKDSGYTVKASDVSNLNIDAPFYLRSATETTLGSGDINPVTGLPKNLGVRVYEAKAPNGSTIANTYIVLQDYVGSGCGLGSANCDWNDNIVLIHNIKPFAQE